jgi:hypothetical protein
VDRDSKSRTSWTTRTVPGRLDMTALAALAGRDRHRPQTHDEMRVAVHEMAARGMSAQSIAAAAQLSVEAVRRMLGERSAP